MLILNSKSIAAIITELWTPKHSTYPHDVSFNEQYVNAMLEMWSKQAKKGTSEIVLSQFETLEKMRVALTKYHFESEKCDKTTVNNLVPLHKLDTF